MVYQPDLSDRHGSEILKSKGQTAAQAHELGHLQGFDYLRVFFMMMVLMAHGDFFRDLAVKREAVVGVGVNAWDYLFFHVQSTAVPSFILMSMVLFALKTATWGQCVDRVKKLAYLYGFWVGAWVLYSKVRPAPGIYEFLEFAFRGGGWLFYTFTVLMLLTPLCWLAVKLGPKGRWVGLAVSALAVLGTFLYLRMGFKWTHRSYYWVPTCFVMMPFVAVLLNPHLKLLQTSSRVRWKWVGILCLLSLASAWFEWRLAAPYDEITPFRTWLPKHARLSAQFGAVAMIVGSLGVKSRANSVVRFFAKNSLGVYCIHPFVLRGIMEPVKRLVNPVAPDLAILAGCVAAAVICSLVSEFLRRAFGHRLI